MSKGLCKHAYVSTLSLFISSFVHLIICLSVYLSICLSVYLSICLSVYLPICLSVYLSICLSVYLSICLSVYISICLSVYLSIYLFGETVLERMNIFPKGGMWKSNPVFPQFPLSLSLPFPLRCFSVKSFLSPPFNTFFFPSIILCV